MKEYNVAKLICKEVSEHEQICAVDLVIGVAERSFRDRGFSKLLHKKRFDLVEFLDELAMDGEVLEIAYAVPGTDPRRAKSIYLPAHTHVWVHRKPK